MTQCARCFAPNDSVHEVEFAYESVRYGLALCAVHLEMFDRDLGAWARMARELHDPRPPSPAAAAAAVDAVPSKIVFPVTNGGVVVKDDRIGPVPGEITPNAMEHTFTEHALMRMRQRHVDRQDVFRLLTQPETTRPGTGSKWPDAEVWTRGNLKIAVNPKQRRVITVGRRDETLDIEKGNPDGSQSREQ